MGSTLAKPRSLMKWKPKPQRMLTRPWLVAATIDAKASISGAIEAMATPIVIFVISSGSVQRFDHQRQKAIAPTMVAKLNAASSDRSQVTGVWKPKKVSW